MYNTALHAEFIRDHADYGFDITLNKFDWGYVVKDLSLFISKA
jgi:glutathione reductase (NADPH)